MVKKIGDKKIGKVQSTEEASEVEKTSGITGIGGVQATSGVSGVRGAGGVGQRRATRVMSAAERAQLFEMINEEADKLFSEGALPAEKKDILVNAVKMAVDSGLIDDEADDGKSKK